MIKGIAYNAVLDHLRILLFNEKWEYQKILKYHGLYYMIVIDNMFYLTMTSTYQIVAALPDDNFLLIIKYSSKNDPGSSRQIAYHNDSVFVANFERYSIDIFDKKLNLIKSLQSKPKRPHAIAIFGHHLTVSNYENDFLEIRDINENYKTIKEFQINNVAYSIFISPTGYAILSCDFFFHLYDYNLNYKNISLSYPGSFNAEIGLLGKLVLLLNGRGNRAILVSK